MKKQTALDWLLEEWPILESQIPPRIIAQAKEMEKEQHFNSYRRGNLFLDDDVLDFEYYFEQYYKYTYGN